MYKISIITVCYNSEKTISATFDSVLKQNYKNYELVVVDGNSTDNTLNIIKEYETKFNGRLKYISEKDNGLYDAMNKGIRMATGDIIGILNSDDYYYDENVLSKINAGISENNSGVYANLLMLEDKNFNIPERKFIAGKGKYCFGFMPPHPTLYLKKEVYDIVGEYNQNFRVAADYDFIIRMSKNKNIKIDYLNEILVCMRPGGTSTNGIKGHIDGVKDSYKVLKSNKVRFPFIVAMLKFIRCFLKALIVKIKSVFIRKK